VGREQPGDRNVELSRRAIELIAQAESETADARPIHDLGKGGVRIKM
jgi:hypothetical protein